MHPIVAFQGESGAFSEKAIEYLVEGPVKLLSCNTFDACTGAVVQGIADLAVIPVQNLIAGPVHAALDALAAAPELEQIGDHLLPVRHALLGLPGAEIGDIREALSHEMALKQCRRFFAEHPGIEAVEAQFADNQKARLLLQHGSYQRITPGRADPVRVQEYLYRQLLEERERTRAVTPVRFVPIAGSRT